MKIYEWFRTPSQEQADRCALLYNKAHGSLLYTVKREQDANEEPVEPARYGFPVGSGSEAGMNSGAAKFEVIRSTCIAGAHPRLTESERVEVLEFVVLGEDLEHDWWCPPPVE